MKRPFFIVKSFTSGIAALVNMNTEKNFSHYLSITCLPVDRCLLVFQSVSMMFRHVMRDYCYVLNAFCDRFKAG